MKTLLLAATAALAFTTAPASAALIQFTITNTGGQNFGNYSFQLDHTRNPDIVTADSVRFGPIAGAPPVRVTYSNVPGVANGSIDTGVTFFAPIQQGGVFIGFLPFGNFRVINTQLITNTSFNPALSKEANRPTFRLGTFAISTTPQNNGPRPFDNYSVTISAVNAVPEPATWAMMIGGFALAGAAVRRSNRRLAAI